MSMAKLRYPLVATKKYPPPALFAASGSVPGHHLLRVLTGTEGTATPSSELDRKALRDSGLAAAVRGLTARRGAEPLGRADAGIGEETLDPRDDEAPAALAGEAETLPGLGSVTHSGSPPGGPWTASYGTTRPG